MRKKEKKIKVDALDADIEENDEKNEPPVNHYYATVAYRYKFAKYVAIVLLVVFVIFSMINYKDSITYSNFVFLVKDINTVFESDGMLNVRKNINYNSDKNQVFTMYRNGLALAGASNIYVYNSAGKQTLSAQIHYSLPRFSVSEKYILLYDLGGKGYSLFNSFAKIHSEELEYPISKAEISDSGVYAVVSSDREYLSSVSVYDKNFECIEKHRKDKYVVDIALDDTGEGLLVAAFESEAGEYYTEISATRIGTGEEYLKLKKNGYFPISVDYTADGGFVLLCDSSLFFFDASGNEISSYDFDGLSLSRADFSEGISALTLSENTAEKSNYLLIFDAYGEKIYDQFVSGKINSVLCYGKFVYLIFDTEIKRVSVENESTYTTNISAGVKDVKIINEKTALLCYGSYTQYVELN